MARHTTDRDPSLYLELDRKQWRDLRQSMPMVLNENELAELVGLGEQIDLDEVADVYLPLSRLIHQIGRAHV